MCVEVSIRGVDIVTTDNVALGVQYNREASLKKIVKLDNANLSL